MNTRDYWWKLPSLSNSFSKKLHDTWHPLIGPSSFPRSSSSSSASLSSSSLITSFEGRSVSLPSDERLVDGAEGLTLRSSRRTATTGMRWSPETLRAAIDLPPVPSSLASSWWDDINESTLFQDGVFFFLCAAYALVAAVALVQLIRIELRVPEYGWTTQKVFHLMNFIVNGVRAVVFGFHHQVFTLHPKVLMLVLLDLPGLLFFSTYTLLVLFWAEIYHQARSLPTDKLKIFYMLINGAIYFIQICIWIYLWVDDNSMVEFVGKTFIAVISIIAALGFLLYGGRLFMMLRRFPIESKGRRKKLHEVGSVTAICFTCFIIRCVVVLLSAFDSDASLDALDHPILNLIYYMLVEVLPSALVLYILRKLPPKRISAQYHPIR